MNIVPKTGKYETLLKINKILKLKKKNKVNTNY